MKKCLPAVKKHKAGADTQKKQMKGTTSGYNKMKPPQPKKKG